MMRLADVKMKPKLVALFLLVGVVPLVLAAWLSYRQAGSALDGAEELSKSSLESQAFNQLVAVRDTRKLEVEKYFRGTTDRIARAGRYRQYFAR